MPDLLFWASEALEVHYVPVVALLFLAAYYALDRKKFFVLVLAFLLAGGVGFGLKNGLAQPRPCNEGSASLIACPADYGLPSLHSASFVVFALASLGSPSFFFFAPLTALSAYSRIYLGLHSVEQVAAGIALGVTAYSFSAALLRMAGQREFREKRKRR